MTLLHSQPENLQDLRQRMNQLFDPSAGESSRAWMPAVDLLEDPHQIVLKAELPGMKKDEIEIELTGETLVLRGERKLEQPQRGEQIHRIERRYGPWQRMFHFEVPVDAQGVKANYADGVLTVHLPKQEAVRPRQIDINVG